MAQERLPALPALAVPDAADLVYVVDVDDATDHATGSSKKSTIGSLPVTEAQIAGANFSNCDSAYGWGDHALVGYLTAETNDLSAAVTWANVPDANITESSVTQHEGAIDHGSITGLGDDDHTQYHNNARGDARYYTETELDAGQLDNRYYTESEVDGLIPTNHLVDNADDTTTGRLTANGFTTNAPIYVDSNQFDDIGTPANKFLNINATKLRLSEDQGMTTPPTYVLGSAANMVMTHRTDGAPYTAGTATITASDVDVNFPTFIVGYTNTSHPQDVCEITARSANSMIFGGTSLYFNGGYLRGGSVGGKATLLADSIGSILMGTSYVGFQHTTGTQSVAHMFSSGRASFVAGAVGVQGSTAWGGGAGPGSGSGADISAGATGSGAVSFGNIKMAIGAVDQTATSLVSGDGSASIHHMTRGVEEINGDGSIGVSAILSGNDTAGLVVDGDASIAVYKSDGATGQASIESDAGLLLGKNTGSGVMTVDGSGSVVMASVSGTQTAQANADNCLQIGPGINNSSESFQINQVGDAQYVFFSASDSTIKCKGTRTDDNTDALNVTVADTFDNPTTGPSAAANFVRTINSSINLGSNLTGTQITNTYTGSGTVSRLQGVVAGCGITNIPSSGTITEANGAAFNVNCIGGGNVITTANGLAVGAAQTLSDATITTFNGIKVSLSHNSNTGVTDTYNGILIAEVSSGGSAITNYNGINIGAASSRVTDFTGISIPASSASGTSLAIDVESDKTILGGELETGAGRIKNTSRYTTTQTILVTDDVIFANTDSAAWTATLPAGVEGQTFKIINSGASGNTLTIEPDGSEDLLGMNSGFTLADRETLVITYNSNDGWF